VVVQDHVRGDAAHQLAEEGLAEGDAIPLEVLVEVVVGVDPLEVVGVDLVAHHEQEIRPHPPLLDLAQDRAEGLVPALLSPAEDPFQEQVPAGAEHEGHRGRRARRRAGAEPPPRGGRPVQARIRGNAVPGRGSAHESDLVVVVGVRGQRRERAHAGVVELRRHLELAVRGRLAVRRGARHSEDALAGGALVGSAAPEAAGGLRRVAHDGPDGERLDDHRAYPFGARPGGRLGVTVSGLPSPVA
jgi:hypothetical protein